MRNKNQTTIKVFLYKSIFIINNMNESEVLYSVDVSGSINKYATVFNINYEKEFSKNYEYLNASNKRKIKINSVNDKTLTMLKEKTEIYHLECLEKLNLELWNNCFVYNKDTEKIEINYKFFVDICCDIQRCFKGTLNFAGKSFTDESLIPGDFDIYYFQYMAYKMFGTSLAIYGFNNLSEIKDKTKNIPKEIISQLVKEKFLENLKNNLSENENENKKCFKKGDVLEFTIFMKDPKLKLLSEKDKLTKMYNELDKKYRIGNSIWNIYFIIL